MTPLDEIENNSMQFAVDYWHVVHTNHDPENAKLYIAAMASALCQLVAQRYSPVTAYNLFQELADKVVEQAMAPRER